MMPSAGWQFKNKGNIHNSVDLSNKPDIGWFKPLVLHVAEGYTATV